MAAFLPGGRPNFSLIRTLDFGDLGLGDVLMAWVGLHALLSNGFRPTARDCLMYVPDELAPLGNSLFATFDIRVHGVRPFSPRAQTSPVFTASPPESLKDWLKTYLGPDWRMHCFDALDAQKTIPLFDRLESRRARLRLFLSEWIFYQRRGWRGATPEYLGYRLWRPLAAKLGLLPAPFLTLIKRALPFLRAEIARYVDERFAAGHVEAGIAIFPAGKSFQTFPASACRAIQDILPHEQAIFYVQADDPWLANYRKAGVNLKFLNSVEDCFYVIRTAKKLLTTDSFASHVAQLLRDDFVLALSRDLRENVVHPGATPTIVAHHPVCAPCSYITRTDSSDCPAKHPNCLAFEDSRYVRDLAASLLAMPSLSAAHY